jgi:hypothetical protein
VLIPEQKSSHEPFCAALLITAKYGDKKDWAPETNELNNMCCGLCDAGMFPTVRKGYLP